MFHWFDNKKERKEVALVLSTGGARGLAHIGAIDELLDRDYHIHSVAGTSMGALIGGMYAAGKLDDFREWMLTIDRKKIIKLLDFSLSQHHIVKGERIIEAMKSVVPDVRIEDLEIPYCAIATDAVSGTEVVFTHGSLYEAIRASISLPLFFSPVRLDDKILIDGGLINPLPLNRVKRQKGDLLVAVNVSGHDYRGQVELRKMIREQQNEKSRFMSLINAAQPQHLDHDQPQRPATAEAHPARHPGRHPHEPLRHLRLRQDGAPGSHRPNQDPPGHRQVLEGMRSSEK